MQLNIRVDQDILQQFANQLGTKVNDGSFVIPEKLGTGLAKKMSFNGNLELVSMQFTLNQPIQTASENPENSPYFLLNINLSQKSVDKIVNTQRIKIQRDAPSGMLFYKPGTSVSSISPVQVPFNIFLVKFPKTLLEHYLNKEELKHILKVISTSNLIYEDLDLNSENYLRETLLPSSNTFQKHSNLLNFLGLFIKKLSSREALDTAENINPTDLKNLFMVAGQLRDPLLNNTPTIENLAETSAMSLTKFKNVFKQVFGTSPYQYHLKAKMQYAYRELAQKSHTVSEISYKLGYSHPSKFTSAFKKHYNILPSKIRA